MRGGLVPISQASFHCVWEYLGPFPAASNDPGFRLYQAPATSRVWGPLGPGLALGWDEHGEYSTPGPLPALHCSCIQRKEPVQRDRNRESPPPILGSMGNPPAPKGPSLEGALLSEVLQQLPVGVIVAEAPSGRLMMANSQVGRIWRRRFDGVDDLASCDGCRGFSPDGREYEAAQWPLARTVATGEPVEGELVRILRGDGTFGEVRIDSSPVCDAGGRVSAAVAVVEDVTEEHAFRADSARLAAIVEGSLDSVITVDHGFRILTWNSGSEQLYGYTASEAVGQLYEMVFPHGAVTEMEQHVRASFEGHRFPPFESVRRIRSGAIIPVSVTLSPVPGPHGEVIAVSAVARDISQQKRLEEELRRANDAKDEFLGFVSHEMRNPLTSVVGLAEVLQRRAGSITPELLRETVGQLVDDAHRLQSLIENMLVLARVEHTDAETEPVLLQRLISRVAREYEAGGRPIEMGIPPGLPPVEAHPTWAEQIIENLVANAVKYSGPEGRIRIEAEASPHDVTVHVLDSGPGVDGEELEKVFLAFQRLERDRFRAQGSGLGLAVCRRLVELMNGSIWAEPPSAGWGGRFAFRLPRVESDPAEEKAT